MNKIELKKTKEELAETDRRLVNLLAERAKLAFKIKMSKSEQQIYEENYYETEDTKQTREMIKFLAREYKEKDKDLTHINFEMLAYSAFHAIISICNHGLCDNAACEERNLKKS